MKVNIENYRGYSGLAKFLDNADNRVVSGIRATAVIREADGAISLIYHKTRVATFWQDGQIRLNSGGWRSQTTKRRINAVLPQCIRLVQRDFEWLVETPSGILPFADGMVIKGCQKC